MDDNTFKLLSLAIGVLSTLGLAVVGYFTARVKGKVDDTHSLIKDTISKPPA